MSTGRSSTGKLVPEPRRPHTTPKCADQVLYVLPDGPHAGEDRPALIVRVPENYENDFSASVRLVVFAEPADGMRYDGACYFTAPYGRSSELGTWRYRLG